MNTEEKLTILKSYISNLNSFTKAQAINPVRLTVDQIDVSNLPELDLVG